MVAQYDFVAGDGGSILRVTIHDLAARELIDLTGKTITLRYAINGGATHTRDMTPLNQTTHTGQADYRFASTDLTMAGEIKGEVRLQDGLPDQLTTIDTFHLRIKAPLP